jgi:nicotinamide-nucleotide amidase
MIEPRLEKRPDLRDVTHRTLVTSGIAESALQERLGNLSDRLGEDLHLAYLPSTRGVRLRLTASEGGTASAEERLDRLEAHIRDRAGLHVIGTGDVTLEEVLGDALRAAGRTVAAAESATGGLIGHRLTGISGSSDYFIGSVVAYANAVKQSVLGVDPGAIESHGAVSEPVAVQMAEGVREQLGVDIGVATTGIAGPTGGTPEKPVGTVWLGYADDQEARAVKQQFVEDRALNKELFASAALDLVRRQQARRAKRR